MALLTRKRLILAKTETTEGTDSVPTGTTNAVLVRNLDIVPMQSDVVSRDLIRPYLGNYEQLLANTRVEVTFEVELAGSGAAGTAPNYGALLKACGLSETVVATTSVTYAPVSSSFSSCTIYMHNDGIKHVVTGARGTFEMNCQVGAIPTLKFTMTGVYNAPTDTALPSATYTNQATPLIFKNGNTSSFSIYSYSGILQSFDFQMANSVLYRELVGGTKQVLITDRKPSGTAMIEAPTIATKDFFSIGTGTTTGAVSFLHGTTAGNKVTFTANQADLSQPAYSDLNGIQMLSLPLVFTPTTAGNDEMSLAFT
jgi:hypothetical protein